MARFSTLAVSAAIMAGPLATSAVAQEGAEGAARERAARDRAAEALLQGAIDAYEDADFARAASLAGQSLALSDQPVTRVYLGSALAYLGRCQASEAVLAPVDRGLAGIGGVVQRRQATFMLKAAAVLCQARDTTSPDDEGGSGGPRGEPVDGDAPSTREGELDPGPIAGKPADPGAVKAEMVRIPGGSFWMGCAPRDSDCTGDEEPLKVDVPAFEIDRTEVTVDAYARCVDAGACTPPERGPRCNFGQSGRGNHPVHCVRWKQAATYCAWAGRRLPTEAEWEKAARGGRRMTFPWGDRAPADCSLAVTSGCGCGEGTCPVGSRPAGATPHGALDMVGNVWEYVQDWYEHTRKAAHVKDPRSVRAGDHRIVKGGSFDEDFGMRVSYRSWLENPVNLEHVGFRCAK